MKEVGKSIRQRLLNVAKTKHINYNVLLLRYFHERFLYRLSLSPYRKSFCLKGGALLYALAAHFPRPTIDIDLLGIRIKNSQENLSNIFTEICKIEFPEDGMIFDYRSIKTVEINVNKKYAGIRISFFACLDTIRQPLQIDIGFGDKPTMQTLLYPNLLDTLPNAEIYAYSTEYVIAEKFHAMIFLSELNSRIKDFYDLYLIIRQQNFDNEKLSEAVKNTFKIRKTYFEKNHPLFSTSFANDTKRLFQWNHFLKKIQVDYIDFEEVVETITLILQPIYLKILDNE
ncbi:MAG: nucleotidyl transferase AbiEii/AbiGii toxin family protein [Tannerella sp.]|jgi:hypothetical protein|nr:nucleotidyl transferase AbiEii/AbiGii toxin family protein [Tannerella sp.]